MLLPTMVPIPMSVCPFLIAITEVTSSGSEVPMAMMVIPITVSDIPRPAGVGLVIAYAAYIGYTLLS
jgi:hypothetical protein